MQRKGILAAAMLAGALSVFAGLGAPRLSKAASAQDDCKLPVANLASRIEACTRWYKSATTKALQAAALAQRANSYLAFSKYDEALQDARAALVLNPAESLAAWIAARVRARQGDYDTALVLYSQTIGLRPTQAQPHIERANIYFKLAKSLAARNDVNEAIRLDPKAAGAYCLRGQLSYADKDLQSALHDLNRGIEIAPKDNYCRRERASVLTDLDETDRAAADVNVLIENSPKMAVIHLLLGKIYLKQGLRQKAEAEFDQYFNSGSSNGRTGMIYKSVVDYTVIYVAAGSPAAQAGIQNNDVVTAVDGISVATMRGDTRIKNGLAGC